jgi:pimeloyl-ACP methyl ester carboxylesterase
MPGVPVRAPGLILTEHELEVPLDHARPDGERITVFAREAADPEGTERPLLLYLQGGPGTEAPRPTRSAPGWLERALQDFRVLMLDQRGTGRSAPVGALAGRTPAEQATYLTHFRADSIVRDAEALRRALGVERWSVLGQSFGGLCAATYLSLAPEGLREVLFTGGVPALGEGAVDAVYAHTYAEVARRRERYFARYPEDRERLRALARRLEREPLVLPSGDRLSQRRVLGTGDMLGMGDGAERLHYLLELDPDSPAFGHDLEAASSFARNPLYAILHEACWADGGATRWAAQRLLPAGSGEPDALTGEHVFPWMFEEIGALAPLREAAGRLAEHDWPRLYDPERLAASEVPAAAAIYAEDMFVPRALSEATAERIGGLRTWLTSEYEHAGLRVDGGRVLGRLLDLTRGRA